ncbi:MAG: diguanylate cyclase [Candidatus Contendobacter sp.]|nr:diguanylate cyclase [Candidatus Contendobacter sp.]
MKAPQPLAKVLLRKVALWYLVFAVGITGAQLFFEYRSARQEIAHSLESLARIFGPGVASALWDYQENLLQSLAQGIGEHSLVTAVDISDLHGRISATHRAAGAETTSPDLMVQQTLYHQFENGQQETLGILSIASSEAKVLARLNSIAVSVGLSITTQLLFLGGMLAVLARLLVVEPLTRFSGEVSRLGVTDQVQPINVGPVEIAEIATLQQGFNQLLRRVAESHSLITAANVRLEQRVAERTQKLNERNQQLVREYELILALVRSVPGFACILDDVGAILIANQSAETLIGSPSIALAGQHWFSLPTLTADHPLRKLLQQVQESGSATTEASFLMSDAGQESTYQFEALQVEDGMDTRIIVVGVDVTKKHQQALQLRHQAFHDRLTGLPNRALLLERLEQTIAVATRRNASFALAFIDIDQFKPINDSAGHSAGDAVLREIAIRLRHCVRESDTVARHGGDEFVLLLPDSTLNGLQRVASAVLAAAAKPIAWEDTQFTVSASIGFAVFPQEGRNAKLLLEAADAAMYRAKQAGRNRADFGTAQAESE